MDYLYSVFLEDVPKVPEKVPQVPDDPRSKIRIPAPSFSTYLTWRWSQTTSLHIASIKISTGK